MTDVSVHIRGAKSPWYVCRSKGMAIRGPVRRGPAPLGRMSASEPFDGTRTTGGATYENTSERTLTAAGIADDYIIRKMHRPA